MKIHKSSMAASLLLSLLFNFAEASSPPPLAWSGDLRIREAQAKEDVDDNRHYGQLRARIGLKAFVNDSIDAHIRLATATSAISTNQTLADQSDPGMPRRGFGIDLAFVNWRFLDSGEVWLGRTGNPFWAPAKSPIIFDGDLSFEGMAIKWHPQWSASNAFLNLGGFLVSENYNTTLHEDVVDTGLVGGEGGYSFATPVGQFTVHAGNYYYINIQNKNITTLDKGAKIDSHSAPYDRYRGNTVYVDTAKYYFSNGYVLLETGAEWKKTFGPVDLTLFFDFVRNDKVVSLNQASEFGLGLKWKSIQFSCAAVRKDSDSVVGGFSDSDSNGGGTDNKGTRWNLSYQPIKNTTVAVSHYTATRGVSTTSRPFSATHVDLAVSF
jgi:hypothetical protein